MRENDASPRRPTTKYFDFVTRVSRSVYPNDVKQWSKWRENYREKTNVPRIIFRFWLIRVIIFISFLRLSKFARERSTGFACWVFRVKEISLLIARRYFYLSSRRINAHRFAEKAIIYREELRTIFETFRKNER